MRAWTVLERLAVECEPENFHQLGRCIERIVVRFGICLQIYTADGRVATRILNLPNTAADGGGLYLFKTRAGGVN